MKNILLPLAAIFCLFVGCHSHATDSTGTHAHDAEGNHVTATAEPVLEPLAYTIYSEKTELFVEFKPLVVGQESRFAAHFTAMGDLFKAINAGSVTLSLVHDGTGDKQTITADAPSVPGIFKLALSPEKAGVVDIVFDIKTPTYTDRITIKQVQVYADEKTALAQQAPAKESGTDIGYLKEQAWRVEFANAPAQVRPFNDVVRTGGQLVAAPGDEAVVTAQVSGIVSVVRKNMVAGAAIGVGATLFSVKTNAITESNLGAAVQQAQNDLTAAKKQYDRAAELVRDKIISEKEYLEAKLQLENAQSQLANVSVSQSYNQNSQSVSAPMSGFLKQILVENGAFVQAGQPLATITKSKRLLLRADISQRYFGKIGTFSAANFKTADTDRTYNTRELNGRVVSVGKSAEAGAPFLPIHFEIDNVGSFVPGTAAEVFLLSNAAPALVIPESALIEEQGVFYCFVQTAGETFQKRALKLGGNDGRHVQVLSGITEGERVVTKGAYQIKLASASGAMPEHGHEH